MGNLVAQGRNIIIRKEVLETVSAGGVILNQGALDENISGKVMALPKFSYHPNGDIKDQELEVGDTVTLMRGKVGTTLPACHIPTEYASDKKEQWLAVSEEFILYKIKG